MKKYVKNEISNQFKDKALHDQSVEEYFDQLDFAESFAASYTISGRGKSPLNLRKRHSRKERLDLIAQRVSEIDKLYEPHFDLPDDEYNSKYTIWLKHLKKIAQNERKYLAPGEKIVLSTFSSTLAEYRAHFKESGYINGLFFRELKYLKKKVPQNSIIFEKFSYPRQKSAKELVTICVSLSKSGNLNDFESDFIENMRRHIYHPIVHLLVLNKEETERISEQFKISLAQKHTNMHIPTIEINPYLSWMEHTLENYESKNYADLAIALGLATGRRPVEVLVKGSFSSPDDYSVLFSGQAKEHLFEKKDYRIPVLFDPKTIIKCLNHLRKIKPLPEDLHWKEFNNSFAKHLNNKVKEIYNQDTITIYNLRAAYAELCKLKFWDPNKDGSSIDYKAKILGHNKFDITTVLHYEAIRLKRSISKRKSHSIISQQEKVEANYDRDVEKFRIDMIKHLKSFEGKFRGAKEKILHFAINQLETKSELHITQTFITKKLGSSRPAIKEFLSIVGEIKPPEEPNIEIDINELIEKQIKKAPKKKTTKKKTTKKKTTKKKTTKKKTTKKKTTKKRRTKKMT